MTKTPAGPRCAALVGPYSSGKTTLLESFLARSGAIPRKGTIKEGNTVGDTAPEARARQMGVEVNIASFDYLGELWTVLDCPGSIDLLQESINAMLVCDIAIVVCEPDPSKAVMVSPLLKFLDDRQIPHMIFINKMDTAEASVRDTVEALQAVSQRPMLLREIPIREGGQITGHVDLVLERAWKWSPDKAPEQMPLPETLKDDEQTSRTELLEALADFDDSLLETLLEEEVPPTAVVFENLARDVHKSLIVPVFFGSADQDNGVLRVLKAMRHDAPNVGQTVERLGIDNGEATIAQVFKTQHASHSGKLSFARVWKGTLEDGMTLSDNRVGGIYRRLGTQQERLPRAVAGEVAALGRLDEVSTGNLLSSASRIDYDHWIEPLTPLFARAIGVEKRTDDVKLNGALAKIVDEDPSLIYDHDLVTGDMLLKGQGHMHLLLALDRLRNKYSLSVIDRKPLVPYKETIRKSVQQHARHKKQTGGHGEFGDVHIEIKPLARGEGFQFVDKISGGSVPRQYIPAVEAGVQEFMARGGPFGFKVVDLEVILHDGSYHAVDSSEMAFKKAAQAAMREGMPKCSPVLLEPIYQVRIGAPTEHTSRVQRMVSGRRGQLLGFDTRAGWTGWDDVVALMPEAEMHDMINELRSLTLGIGTFESSFDHLQELGGREADDVVAARKAALEAD